MNLLSSCRKRHWLVLEWLLFLNSRDEVTYSLAYGDKDTFRAAFFLADRLQDFQPVAHPLSLALHNVSASDAMVLYKSADEMRVRSLMQFRHSGPM